MVNNVSRSNTNGGHHHEDGQSSGGGSGLMSSPSRFQHDLLLENEDEGDHMRLRNPQPNTHDVLSPHAALVLQGTAAPGAPSQNNDRIEVCVLEALQ